MKCGGGRVLFVLWSMLFAMLVAGGGSIVLANNIIVTNAVLTEKNWEEGTWKVQFDLSWENSWRTDNLFPDDGHDVGNWDAAWVFMKYRVDGGEWKHAKLRRDGHNAGTGTPAAIQIGRPDEREPFDMSANPGVGAFLYRSEVGNGNFALTSVQLLWDFGSDSISISQSIDIGVFAIEMVYVAPGSFYLGSGGSEAGRFIAGGTTNDPFLVTAEWDKSIGNTSGSLWGSSTTGVSTIGPEGNLDPHYPSGVEGFYCMKYEISQQQYVDFLNTLTPTQASAMAYTGGANRNGIQLSGGVYSTTNPYVANNFMSWMDGAAYLDWAGLRPMTELEFEKAARGPATPVADEYVWGTSFIADLAYTLNTIGENNEGIATNYSTVSGEGNASYSTTDGTIDGPLRVGIFVSNSSASDRVTAGASYWGVMELSGNVWERSVTVGNTTGRAFTGLHGDGVLTGIALGNVAFWPGGGSGGISGANGSGLRGGGWSNDSKRLQASNRDGGAYSDSFRSSNRGFRGVRGLPVDVGVGD